MLLLLKLWEMSRGLHFNESYSKTCELHVFAFLLTIPHPQMCVYLCLSNVFRDVNHPQTPVLQLFQ